MGFYFLYRSMKNSCNLTDRKIGHNLGPICARAQPTNDTSGAVANIHNAYESYKLGSACLHVLSLLTCGWFACADCLTNGLCTHMLPSSTSFCFNIFLSPFFFFVLLFFLLSPFTLKLSFFN